MLRQRDEDGRQDKGEDGYYLYTGSSGRRVEYGAQENAGGDCETGTLYATSRDGRTFLRTATEEATTNLTLQEMESRLSGRGFCKAHRAYLVNLQHVKAVIQYTRNSYILQPDDKQETNILLSKQSEKALQDLLGY
ncbi:MAG: LytTR family DNA-binding domain-containing protein [Ktedonobacterales bacterium]